MSKTKVVIVFLVIVLVLFLIFAFKPFGELGGKRQNSDNNSIQTLTQGQAPPLNIENQSNKKSQEKIIFETTQGNVQLYNFFSYPKTIRNESDEIITFANTPEYFVYYSYDGNFFAIEITEPRNLATARKNAEFALLSTLELENQTEACKLPIDVYLVNQFTKTPDSTNFGLSFCPGSMLLFDGK